MDPTGRFVVQEHYATSHHFDLRLEQGATLWSWAVPKGLPTDPGENRLAIRVEDHGLEHLEYEDFTPVDGGPEGAVVKSNWDSGTYEVVRSTDTKFVLDLHGSKVDARFALFRTGGSDWMLHLMQ